MEFGIQVGGDYATLLDAAEFAEQRGLASLAVFDHYLMSDDEAVAATTPAFDAFVHLGALAWATSTVELLALVTPVTFRHPAVVAKMAVTLDHMSGGRFKLGVGSGWFEREHEIFGIDFPGSAERFERLDEMLGYLTAAFDPAHPGFTGTHYRLEAFPLAPPPLDTIPLLIGGSGARRTPRLAGTYAGEYDLIELELDDLEGRIAAMRQAAERAGRDPDSILLSYNSPVQAFDTDDDLAEAVRARADATGRSADEMMSGIERSASAVGTWDQIRAKLAFMESLGIGRYYIGFWDTPWNRDETGHFLDQVSG